MCCGPGGGLEGCQDRVISQPIGLQMQPVPWIGSRDHSSVTL